jgi:hypothetical protein
MTKKNIPEKELENGHSDQCFKPQCISVRCDSEFLKGFMVGIKTQLEKITERIEELEKGWDRDEG